VRVTAQTGPLRRTEHINGCWRGCDVPLVADIHFKRMRMEAARWVGEGGVNPGNYVTREVRGA